MTAKNLQFSSMNNSEAFVDLKMDSISFSLAGDNVIVSGQTGKKILAYRIFVVVGGATDLTFKDGVTTSLTGAIPMVANGSITLDLNNVPWFQTSSGKDLVLTSSQSVQVSGAVYYQAN